VSDRIDIFAMSEDHSADRARLLAHVPYDGQLFGNIALMRSVKWSEHRYWYARDSLLQEGTTTRAKGRGGAVRRVLLEEDAAPEAVWVGAIRSLEDMASVIGIVPDVHFCDS
jgi:hypothetical protein